MFASAGSAAVTGAVGAVVVLGLGLGLCAGTGAGAGAGAGAGVGAGSAARSDGENTLEIELVTALTDVVIESNQPIDVPGEAEA